jgi:Domain of unknown function (DUF4062)
LVTVVFPDPSTSLRAGLRERVEQLGLEFFDVDPGGKDEGRRMKAESDETPQPCAANELQTPRATANSWEYCRQWIDRVEPFFVCILGQRYGWVPEPHQFREPADRQRQSQEPRSITDLEVRHASSTN